MSQSLASIFGMKIVIAGMTPRYTLPAEVIPGVPWPAGFREEFNSWSKSFLGGSCILKSGQTFVMKKPHTIVVYPADYGKLAAL